MIRLPFNRRRTRHATFRSLLRIAVAHRPLPYNMWIFTGSKDIRLCGGYPVS